MMSQQINSDPGLTGTVYPRRDLVIAIVVAIFGLSSNILHADEHGCSL